MEIGKSADVDKIQTRIATQFTEIVNVFRTPAVREVTAARLGLVKTGRSP